MFARNSRAQVFGFGALATQCLQFAGEHFINRGFARAVMA